MPGLRRARAQKGGNTAVQCYKAVPKVSGAYTCPNPTGGYPKGRRKQGAMGGALPPKVLYKKWQARAHKLQVC